MRRSSPHISPGDGCNSASCNRSETTTPNNDSVNDDPGIGDRVDGQTGPSQAGLFRTVYRYVFGAGRGDESACAATSNRGTTDDNASEAGPSSDNIDTCADVHSNSKNSSNASSSANEDVTPRSGTIKIKVATNGCDGQQQPASEGSHVAQLEEIIFSGWWVLLSPLDYH